MPAYDPDNIFAKILRGELPCYKVYEDEHVFAFLIDPKKVGSCGPGVESIAQPVIAQLREHGRVRNGRVHDLSPSPRASPGPLPRGER